MMIKGKRQWVDYETLAVDGEDFVQIGENFEYSHTVNQTSIGNALVKCMNVRELVDFAVNWIENNRKPN